MRLGENGDRGTMRLGDDGLGFKVESGRFKVLLAGS
jgi:hypothetical protein